MVGYNPCKRAQWKGTGKSMKREDLGKVNMDEVVARRRVFNSKVVGVKMCLDV